MFAGKKGHNTIAFFAIFNTCSLCYLKAVIISNSNIFYFEIDLRLRAFITCVSVESKYTFKCNLLKTRFLPKPPFSGNVFNCQNRLEKKFSKRKSKIVKDIFCMVEKSRQKDKRIKILPWIKLFDNCV